MMSIKQSFKLYDVVNKYFRNKEDSKTLVYEIGEIINNKIDLKMTDFATKKDIAELKFDFSELKIATKQDIAELKFDFASLRADMERGFKDQLKWIIVLMLSFVSIIITVIKLL